MNELDEKWSVMLRDAIERTRSDGRSDVAEYLELRSINDALRDAGIKWLFDSIVSLATQTAGVSVERLDPHSFSYQSANIVGSKLITIRGVRRLTLEAGWPRTPGDGIVRRGAMAIARIVHFGMRHRRDELGLFRTDSGVAWLANDGDAFGPIFDGERLREHFEIFMKD